MIDRWTARLSEYIDGDLTPADRAALEAHLPGCAECARALDELRSVVSNARTLEPPALAADLWPAIEARIAPRAPAPVSWRGFTQRRLSFSLPQLAAAAAAIVMLSGGLVWLALERRLPTAPGAPPAARPIASASPSATPGSFFVPGDSSVPSAPDARGADSRAMPVATIANFGVVRYDAAIADLERVLREHRGELDTTTVKIVERNLAVIDRAIADARRALAADPADLYLNDHLASTMRRKMDMLRRATAAMSFPS